MIALFASIVLAQFNPAPPAPPRITPDFRLVSRDGSRSGLMNINGIHVDAAGRRTGFVYAISEDEPPTVDVFEIMFDCTARTVATLSEEKLDRTLALIDEGDGYPAETPQPGSILGKALVLVCGPHQAWGAAPYLGAGLATAVRRADPRFR